MTDTTTSSETTTAERKKRAAAAALRELKIKMIKELDDIIQKTPAGEVRTDLEFTRKNLIRFLYEEEEEKADDDSRHGQ